MSEGIAMQKSYSFALRVLGLYKHLCDEKKEYVLSKKVMDSGTAIGAKVKSAQEAISKPIFANEMGVALQKASETQYWLQLLRDASFLSEREFDSIHEDCVELIKILKSISKSAQPRL